MDGQTFWLLFTCLFVVVNVVGWLWMVYEAAQVSLSQAILALLVPFYAIYFAFSQHARRHPERWLMILFALSLVPIFIGAGMVAYLSS